MLIEYEERGLFRQPEELNLDELHVVQLGPALTNAVHAAVTRDTVTDIVVKGCVVAKIVPADG